MRLRTVQQLFNVVIDSGHYSNTNPYTAEKGSAWMCCAVGDAYEEHLITYDEREKVLRAINGYLHSMYGGQGLLRTALNENGLPCEFNDRLAIYRDWKNRPRKVK